MPKNLFRGKETVKRLLANTELASVEENLPPGSYIKWPKSRTEGLRRFGPLIVYLTAGGQTRKKRLDAIDDQGRKMVCSFCGQHCRGFNHLVECAEPICDNCSGRYVKDEKVARLLPSAS